MDQTYGEIGCARLEVLTQIDFGAPFAAHGVLTALHAWGTHGVILTLTAPGRVGQGQVYTGAAHAAFIARTRAGLTAVQIVDVIQTRRAALHLGTAAVVVISAPEHPGQLIRFKSFRRTAARHGFATHVVLARGGAADGARRTICVQVAHIHGRTRQKTGRRTAVGLTGV